MDNLFTPEVIQQILEILTKATEEGSKAVILWLMLPLLATLTIATSWLIGIYFIVKSVVKVFIKHGENKLVQLEIQNRPKEYKIGDKIINEDVALGLRAFLSQEVSETKYFHASDLNCLIKAWRSRGE